MEHPRPFTIVTPKKILREIESYANWAKAAGQFAKFKYTLQIMVDGLEIEPSTFGDLQRHLKGMNVDQYIAVRGPWAFTYGIHAEKKLVFIRSAKYSLIGN